MPGDGGQTSQSTLYEFISLLYPTLNLDRRERGGVAADLSACRMALECERHLSLLRQPPMATAAAGAGGTIRVSSWASPGSVVGVGQSRLTTSECLDGSFQFQRPPAHTRGYPLCAARRHCNSIMLSSALPPPNLTYTSRSSKVRRHGPLSAISRTCHHGRPPAGIGPRWTRKAHSTGPMVWIVSGPR